MKNYEFNFTFNPPWGECAVVMTSVIGHLNSLEFDPNVKQWKSCAPASLFDARVYNNVEEVGDWSMSVKA